MQINVISTETVDTPKNNSPVDNRTNNFQFQVKINPPSAIQSLKNLLNSNEHQNNDALQPQQQQPPSNISQLEALPYLRSRIKKRTSKFISNSFIHDDPAGQFQTADNSQQQIQTQQQLLEENVRYKSCLKSKGKFTRSCKKKRSKSINNDPIILESLKNINQDDEVNYEPLKSSIKVNFNQKVRVDRVESYKAFNVLEDELKEKIIRNSRFTKEEARQSMQKRSKQPSIADALGAGGQQAENNICCMIF